MDIEHLNYELKKREDLILEEHSVGKSCPLKCGSLEDTCMHAASSCYVTFIWNIYGAKIQLSTLACMQMFGVHALSIERDLEYTLENGVQLDACKDERGVQSCTIARFGVQSILF